MAYPTGMLSLVLEGIDQRIVGLKSYTQKLSAQAAAGSVTSTRILNSYGDLKGIRADLVLAAATAGLVEYARAQKNNGTLDVVAEFNALIAQIDTTVQWIADTFPKDGNGYLLAQTLGAIGPTDRLFTSAQTGGFRTQLDAIVALIA